MATLHKQVRLDLGKTDQYGKGNEEFALLPTPTGYALWLTTLEAQNCLRGKKIRDVSQSIQDANYSEHFYNSSSAFALPCRRVSHTLQPISESPESLQIAFNHQNISWDAEIISIQVSNWGFIYGEHQSRTSTGIFCLTRSEDRRNGRKKSHLDFQRPRFFVFVFIFIPAGRLLISGV